MSRQQDDADKIAMLVNGKTIENVSGDQHNGIVLHFVDGGYCKLAVSVYATIMVDPNEQ